MIPQPATNPLTNLPPGFVPLSKRELGYFFHHVLFFDQRGQPIDKLTCDICYTANTQPNSHTVVILI